MYGPMLGIPMSPSTWLLTYALMDLVVVAIYAVLFSVGTGLEPKEAETVHPMRGRPTRKDESRPISHAA
jgi:hypothetical protein